MPVAHGRGNTTLTTFLLVIGIVIIGITLPVWFNIASNPPNGLCNSGPKNHQVQIQCSSGSWSTALIFVGIGILMVTPFIVVKTRRRTRQILTVTPEIKSG